MPRRFRARLIGVVAVSACGFTGVGLNSDGQIQQPIDAVVVDAGPCPSASEPPECVSNNERLRQCEVMGMPPVDTICGWGCSPTPTAHCQKLTPSGGALTPQDLERGSAALADKELIVANSAINTDTGEITGYRTAGTGVISGIEFFTRGNVGVFRFQGLTISGLNLNVRGSRALALVSITSIDVNAVINAQGDCNQPTASVGGGAGGAARTDGGSGAQGGGSGAGDNTTCSGGGGGGHGDTGGIGGGQNGGTRGVISGTASITALVGGGGGGGGGGTNGGNGGKGGGAIQLAANHPITISVFGGINAGGCGGDAGTSCGGGGGAGGAVLLEAPIIILDATSLAVNGGGGGGGSAGSTGGENGQLSTSRASGGNGGPGPNSEPDGGDGGDGGDNDTLSGADGEDQQRGGGAGGGVGRMRFNTKSGTVTLNGPVVLSPGLSTPVMTTPVTQGVAVIQ